MESEELKLVRKGFDAWNRGDLEAWLSEMSPDVVARAGLAGQLAGEEFRGQSGMRRWWADYHEAFDEVLLHADSAELLDEDRLLVLGRAYYRGSASGIEQERPWGWIFWRDHEGRTTRVESYDDPAAARAAAGIDQA